MNPRTIIFHPALAPYRVDFFNSLSEAFDAIETKLGNKMMTSGNNATLNSTKDID